MCPAGGFGGGRTGWNGQREIICPPPPAFLPTQISSALQGLLHGGLDSAIFSFTLSFLSETLSLTPVFTFYPSFLSFSYFMLSTPSGTFPNPQSFDS